MAIWVTSDLHFNHKNILHTCRPQFKNIGEHDEYIIQKYNSVVAKDDLVYLLGDIGFSSLKNLFPLVQRLNGRKILIVGNHDKLTDGEYRKMGFIDVVRHPVYFSKNIILSHCPLRECLDNPWVINVHGHIHNGKLTLPNYINANVENHGFLPLDLKKIEAEAEKVCRKSRYERFGQEWYASWEEKFSSSLSFEKKFFSSLDNSWDPSYNEDTGGKENANESSSGDHQELHV